MQIHYRVSCTLIYMKRNGYLSALEKLMINFSQNPMEFEIENTQKKKQKCTRNLKQQPILVNYDQ